jgi:hypothetical protein
MQFGESLRCDRTASGGSGRGVPLPVEVAFPLDIARPIRKVCT